MQATSGSMRQCSRRLPLSTSHLARSSSAARSTTGERQRGALNALVRTSARQCGRACFRHRALDEIRRVTSESGERQRRAPRRLVLPVRQRRAPLHRGLLHVPYHHLVE